MVRNLATFGATLQGAPTAFTEPECEAVRDWVAREIGLMIKTLSIVLLLTLASVVQAQGTQTCGIVGVDGSSELETGMPLVLKVKITGPIHTTKPEFKWKVSVGTITMGQGTDEVTVDTTGLGGQIFTVSVELVGAPVGCNGFASKTVQVKPPPPACEHPFDEFGNIKSDDEKARLDNFVIAIQNYPLAVGSIQIFAGQETYENEATERLNRAKSYLSDFRGLDRNRIVTVDCGFAKELTINLWVVPPGATFPECKDLEIPFSEVKFTKRPPQSKSRRVPRSK